MLDYGVQEIGMFYLGESFLVDWLPEAIKYAKDIGYPYIFLTTNGSLSTVDKVEKCMAAGLNSLKFSYNYYDAEQFNEITGVKPAIYETIKKNIKTIWQMRNEKGFDCTLSASYIMYDGDQSIKMQEALDDIKNYVDKVYALPLYNQAALIDNQEWEFSQGNRGRYDALVESLPCWSIFQEAHITFDGMLSACCFDHDGRFHMADLNKVSFSEGWNSELFQSLRKAHLEKNVRNTVCETCLK